MIPIHVTIQDKVAIQVADQRLMGQLSADDAGVTAREEGENLVLFEPFNRSTVTLRRDGLNAINVIATGDSVYVVGNYSSAKVQNRCCVSCGGTTACCMHASIECNGVTVSC